MNVVITGGNFGIGYETAKGLYIDGHNIIFGSRDQAKNQIALQNIKSSTQSGQKGTIKSFKLDLSSKKSVIEFSGNVRKQFDHIDILINNAGIMALPEKLTSVQGFQMQMATNHLGHFQLTSLLFDLIKKSKSAKIINVSSGAHNMKKEFDAEDLNCQKSKYSPWGQYSLTKIANIIFTNKLSEIFQQRYPNISAYSLHPGVVRTGLINQAGCFLRCIAACFGCCYKSPEQGAQTTLFLARTQRAKLKDGGYYVDCELADVNKVTQQKEHWNELWKKSESLLDIKFVI